MTDEAKALVELQRAAGLKDLPTPLTHDLRIAVSGKGPRAYDWQDKPHRLLYDACAEIETQAREIEQHEAFKLEVSDAVVAFRNEWLQATPSRQWFQAKFTRFILPKPDPLVEAMQEWWDADGYADIETFRAAIEKRGGKIVWED